jgi:hypothetical protein
MFGHPKHEQGQGMNESLRDYVAFLGFQCEMLASAAVLAEEDGFELRAAHLRDEAAAYSRSAFSCALVGAA